MCACMSLQMVSCILGLLLINEKPPISVSFLYRAALILYVLGSRHRVAKGCEYMFWPNRPSACKAAP